MSREYGSIKALIEMRDFLVSEGIKHGILDYHELKDVGSYRFTTDIGREPRLQQTLVNSNYAEYLRTSLDKTCRNIQDQRRLLKAPDKFGNTVDNYLSDIAYRAKRAWEDFVGHTYVISLISASMTSQASCKRSGREKYGETRLDVVIPSTYKTKVLDNGLSYFMNNGEKALVIDANPVSNILADECDAQLFEVLAFGKLSKSTLGAWMNRLIKDHDPNDGLFSASIIDHPISNFIDVVVQRTHPCGTKEDFVWSQHYRAGEYKAYMCRSKLNGYVGSGMTSKAAIKLMDRRNVKGFIDQLRD